MRMYDSIKPVPTKCYHGVPMKKHCLDCIDYFIREKETQIRLLKQTRKYVLKLRGNKK